MTVSNTTQNPTQTASVEQPTKSVPPTEPQAHVQQTNPNLVMYALAVYAYYFSAKFSKQSIMSNDPTADGLFTMYNYSRGLEAVDTDSSQSAEIEQMFADLNSDPSTAIEDDDENDENSDAGEVDSVR